MANWRNRKFLGVSAGKWAVYVAALGTLGAPFLGEAVNMLWLYLGTLTLLTIGGLIALEREEGKRAEDEDRNDAGHAETHRLLKDFTTKVSPPKPSHGAAGGGRLDAALYNDWLASDTIGNILRMLAEGTLSPATRDAGVRDLIRDYVKDRKRLSASREDSA